MYLRFARRGPRGLALSGMTLLALAVPPVSAQVVPPGGPNCPPAPCPVPAAPPALSAPPAAAAPGTPAPGTPATPQAPGAQAPGAPPAPQDQAPPGADMAGMAAPGETQGAATGGETGGLATPNMMGDLLYGYRSVSFYVNRSTFQSSLDARGGTSVINPAVADNNSPIPRDRVGFRYNLFHNAQAVAGAQPGPLVFDPRLGSLVETPFTRLYDRNQYTFDLEKTLLDDHCLSVNVRIPFFTGLASDLDLSYGTVVGIQPATTPGVPAQAGGLEVNRTPERTLGHEDTEFGDMQVIFKALFYHNCWLALSGGVGFNIPTGQDTHVRVTDYLGFSRDANLQRVRDFQISNDTWSANPFLAAVIAPSDCFFVQGFAEVEIPLNNSTITYTEAIPLSANAPFGNTIPIFPNFQSAFTSGALPVPFQVTDTIREQKLLHVDIGTGYWLMRNSAAKLITGFAPVAELHYTTTLQDADIATLPRDATARRLPVLPPAAPLGTVAIVPSPGPTVGNLRGRLDIVNLTLGGVMEFGNRATCAAGFVIPLSGGDNKTFDWEFQLQFNYIFGVCPKPSCTCWNAFSCD
jgi:hypothetical protein